MRRLSSALILLVAGFSCSHQPPNPRTEIAAAYERADAANVAARTLADVEAIREWLDTPDCVYADFGQAPRGWADMRRYAAEGLSTRIVTFRTTIQEFAATNGVVTVKAAVTGAARVQDQQGTSDPHRGEHDIETTATVRDTWVRTDHWRRKAHIKVVANHLTAIDGKPLTQQPPR